MSKDKISDYSATANSNTDIAGINIDEGCAPSGINNAIRTLMKQLKDFQQGTNSDSFNGPVNGTVGATTPAAGAFTTLSASSTVSGAGFSTYLASPPAIGGTAAAAGSFTTLSASGNVTLGDASTDTLNVGNGGLVKDASGNVGIGTSSPSAQLHVKNGGGNSISILGQYGSGTMAQIGAYANQMDIKAYNGTNDVMTFTTGASERMRIDSSGNVGVGTASPSTYGKFVTSTATDKDGVNIIFPVAPTGTNGPALNFWNNSNTALYKGASIQGICVAGGGGGYSDLTFGTTNNGTHAERARIDYNGNLLVGTTSAIGAGKISIPFDQVSSRGISVQSTNATNTGTFLSFYNSSGSQQGYITQTNSTTTQYATSSDYRLKENVQPMQGALATVAQLKPCTYTWKADGSDAQGFIAHELQAVVPDCVTGEKDAVDEDGNPVYQGIDTSFLVATLTAAIQEQQAIIEQLRADVETLKAK